MLPRTLTNLLLLCRQEDYPLTGLYAALVHKLVGDKARAWSGFLPKKPVLPPWLVKALNKTDFSPADLGFLQALLQSDGREKGVFYTPDTVARQLAEQTLFYVLCRQGGLPAPTAQALLNGTQTAGGKTLIFLKNLTVCDPACGAGNLLIPFAQKLADLIHKAEPQRPYGQILAQVVRQNLYAGDISRLAIDTFKLRLALLTDLTPRDFPNLRVLDALSAVNGQPIWQTEFPAVFTQKNGFDIVLSNPPYVGQKNHRAVFASLRKNPLWQDKIMPKSDLLYLFFHLALKILHPSGTAGFLTTPYFATAQGGALLRKTLRQNATFVHLQDFGEQRLFAAAGGHHSLISIFEKGKSESPCTVNGTSVPQYALFRGANDYLLLQTGGNLNKVLAKMEKVTRTLKEVAAVTNGLMTGCDKISAAHLKKFTLPGIKKGDGVFVLSSREKTGLILSETEKTKLKPFFKNSDIFPYAPRQIPNRWLIDFFYPGDKNTDFSQYPALRAHLQKFAPVLLARKQNNNGIDKVLKRGEYWFGSVRRKMNFDVPKLAVPQRAPKNTFAYTPGPWYASSDVYFISAPRGVSLWYLLALFNSAPYYAWLFYKGKRKGNLLELYSAPLNDLPVPFAGKQEQAALEKLAKQIYTLKAKNQQANTEFLESEVNRLAGSVLRLTETELARCVEFLRRQTAKKDII